MDFIEHISALFHLLETYFPKSLLYIILKYAINKYNIKYIKNYNNDTVKYLGSSTNTVYFCTNHDSAAHHILKFNIRNLSTSNIDLSYLLGLVSHIIKVLDHNNLLYILYNNRNNTKTIFVYTMDGHYKYELISQYIIFDFVIHNSNVIILSDTHILLINTESKEQIKYKNTNFFATNLLLDNNLRLAKLYSYNQDKKKIIAKYHITKHGLLYDSMIILDTKSRLLNISKDCICVINNSDIFDIYNHFGYTIIELPFAFYDSDVVYNYKHYFVKLSQTKITLYSSQI